MKTVRVLCVWGSVLLGCLAAQAPDAQGRDFCSKPPVAYTTGSAPSSICAADFDNDGHPDLAVTNSASSSISILRNLGNGTFEPKADYPTGLTPHYCFASDLNRDGYPDLVVSHYNLSPTLTVFINRGNGAFYPGVDYPAGLDYRQIACADFNHDGWPDVAVTDAGGTWIMIYPNAGDGTLLDRTYVPAVPSLIGLNAVDIDHDGDIDLLTCNGADNFLYVLKNKGNGEFDVPSRYATGVAPIASRCADLDRDGDLDVVTANSGGTVSILRNNGDGTFQPHVDLPAGPNPTDVRIADFNGDGLLDLAAGQGNNAYVYTLKGHGDGTFGTADSILVASNTSMLVSADLDSDGDIDLAISNYYSDQVSAIINCSPPLVVGNLADSGPGSLRTAIDYANNHPGPDTITFLVAGTLSLINPLSPTIDLSGGTIILGFTAPGASSPFLPTLILDGSGSTPGPGLELSSPNNRIEGLTFRHFNGAGIAVIGASSVANTITGCRFYANAGPGIDLGNDGITPNDTMDADTGPNTLLNYPFFDSLLEVGLNTFAAYGRAAISSHVELFLAAEAGNSGYQPEATLHGPAYMLLGSTTAAGDGHFSFPSIAMPEWSRVTATATDPAGNTSELALNKVLAPDPLRITGYSESVPPLRGAAFSPLSSPALQVIVYSPPFMGHIDSIGPSFNTFGSRASYDSTHDYNSGGLVDARVTIVAPDTGEYRTKYVLIGDPGNYVTGIGIDGHSEAKKNIAFGIVGQVDSTTYHLVAPLRGELTGDGAFDVMDVMAAIGIVFSNKPMPDPPELIDVNCDHVPDVLDVLYLITYVFVNGPAPCR